MTILCRHVQVYTLGRLTIDGFSFERVGQFNREWIFIKLYSGFQSLVGFRILSAVFRIPKPRIPDSGSKKFLDSGIRIPLHGGIHYSWKELKNGKVSRPEPVGRIAKTSWPRRTRFKQIFCSSRKDSTYRKCSIALFLVASMSA